MGWIDYRKDYDMAPYSWVIENSEGIAKYVMTVLGKMMKFWRVELTCSAEIREEVPI